MTKRIFTREYMEENDIPYNMEYKEIEEIDRWNISYSGVFKAEDDGKYYEIGWYEGATEDQWGTDLWSGEDEIEGTEVELREVTVTKWLPKEEC